MIADNIRSILTASGMDATVQPIDEATPVPRVLLFLGTDEKGREKSMAISVIDQALPEGSAALVQCRFVFPFAIHESASGDTARTAAMLNSGMEIPGLEVSELDGEVAFRYSWLCEEGDEKKITPIVGYIMMTADLYSPVLEEVASGGSTFIELLEKTVQQLGS
jgi:hypothetical protein